VREHCTLKMVPSSSPNAALDPVDELVASMPQAYPQIFERRDIAEHVDLINARGSRRAFAGEWRQLPGGTVIVCIVADDVPGLLSLVSTVFVSHHLDVSSAQIFCRARPEGVEAVDFFWLKRARPSRLPQHIDSSEIDSVSRMLDQLLGEESQGRLLAAQELERIAPELPVRPRVFYDTRALRRGEVILNVVTPDRPGLLLAITLSFVSQGLEVVASEVRTDQGIASDRFTLRDAAGDPLSANRLADIQRQIIAALKTEAAPGTAGPITPPT
jgi:UTP:GlnB (protein PII) uridylyltransferase